VGGIEGAVEDERLNTTSQSVRHSGPFHSSS
jgi:hypothetical protein